MSAVRGRLRRSVRRLFFLDLQTLLSATRIEIDTDREEQQRYEGDAEDEGKESALGDFFVLRTGRPPHGLPPTLAQAYAARGAEVKEEVYANPVIFRARKVARSLRAPEPRVAASIAHLGFAARLWSVALGSAALYGRVPDLDPRLLRWDPDASAPDELWLTEVRGLPVERFPRWECAPFTERDRAELKEGLAKTGAPL